MVISVRIKISFGWKPLEGLVDSGATMNFITQIAAKKLDLPTTEDRAPNVTTLDGHDLLTFGMH